MNKNLQQTLNEAMNQLAVKPKSCGEPSQQLPLASHDLRQKYGTASQFLITFSKDIQPAVAANLERTFMGKAPSLRQVREAYSQELLTTWIMAQIENLNDFAGVANKMNISQIEEMANIIAIDYHYLKVSELHLFLHRMKAGRYGEFYGSIDPMRIMNGLARFASERLTEINAYERTRHNQQMETLRSDWAKTGITRHEYEQLINKNNKPLTPTT